MRKLVSVAVVSIAASGCASSQGERRADETAMQEQALSAQSWCPMAVEGTTVRAEETEDGAALAFTTTGDVGELQKRLAAMEEKHGKKREKGGTCPCPCGMGPGAGGMGPGPHGGMHGGGMGPQGGMQGDGMGPRGGMPGGGMGPHGGMTPEMHAGMMAMRQAEVRMEKTERGGRLVFTPADPAQLPALRQAVQARAQMMASGGCPWMGQGGMRKGAPPAGEAG